jgi:DNA-directed RNA polymerase subunit RPC12/RpoP
MAQFTCSSCSKTFKAPDSLAGKRVACPSCKTIGVVPAAAPDALQSAVQRAAQAAAKQPQPPAKPVAADSAIEDLLAEERIQREAARATTIQFECAFCAEPIEVAAELAGKRQPCPSCSRIVQVPVPKVADPADWRAKNRMASAIKLEVEKGPEGAWDGSASKGVSREALEEANALPVRPVKKVPLATRLKTYGLVALLLLVGGLIALQFMGKRAARLEVQAVETLLTEGAKDAEFSKNKVLLACLEIQGADALLGATANPQADKALKHYSMALRAAQEAPQSAARDMVLGQLATSIAERVGDKQKGGNDPKRLPSDDGHRLIRESVSRIGDPELQVDAWQQVCKALVKDGQSQRAAALSRQIFGGLSANQENRNRERMNLPVEGLSVAGLVMLRDGKRKSDQEALGLSKQLAQEVAKKLDAKSVIPESGVALVVASGEAYPGTWNDAKHDAELWGLAWGKALAGNATEAAAIAARSDGDQVDRLRAKVATVLGQDPPPKDAREVVDLAAQTASTKPLLAGTLLRLARLGEDAGWPAASVAALGQPLLSAAAGSAEAEIRGEILLITRRIHGRQGGEVPAILSEDRAWTARSAARRDSEPSRDAKVDSTATPSGYFSRLGRLLSADLK